MHVETRDPAATLRAIAELPNVNAPGATGAARAGPASRDAARRGDPLLDLVDVLLVLAVTPGVPGTDPAARDPAGRRSRLIADGRDVLVAFDGGVKPDDVGALAGLGRRPHRQRVGDLRRSRTAGGRRRRDAGAAGGMSD